MVGVDVIMLVDICCLQMEPFTILYPSFLPPRPLYLHRLFSSREQLSTRQTEGEQTGTVTHITRITTNIIESK